ncbi:MucR family transcriptional regulator [Labrys sp. ZIDIC5]|uniref:MucR family transcriptional regulator n=1 Tax=Labrys sedimenti TaxID=3106036 RepID=UPI002ACAEC6B|nr:MucR family transcriptional regulator [Labrys sp. ZIDIC5]MDZ5454769.1 MucR family transcriptional regulator [Labrys sp. ZIDIC5]
MPEEDASLVDLTVDIVSAYVSNNQVATASLADLIHSVHKGLTDLNNPRPVEAVAPPKPAVPIKKSVTPDYVICLEDGLKFKSLTRHLRTAYGLTPEQYREKWGLPSDYPMVAPNYSATRSRLARELGLGQMNRKAISAPPPPPAPSKGRKKKAA